MAAHAVTSVGDKLKRACVRLAFSRDVDANLGIHDESLGRSDGWVGARTKSRVELSGSEAGHRGRIWCQYMNHFDYSKII